jgi:hypothetical protein
VTEFCCKFTSLLQSVIAGDLSEYFQLVKQNNDDKTKKNEIGKFKAKKLEYLGVHNSCKYEAESNAISTIRNYIARGKQRMVQ